MIENKFSYHDTVLDLEAKLKKNVEIMMKFGNSLQGMFMLGPKPLSMYDPRLKHGLGYLNPYTLKQAISQCPKLYRASSLGNPEVPLDVRDIEDILDDASKSQNKMKEKMNDPIAVAKKQNCWSINYKKINALYDDFVPQKELSTEQKYFLSSFISSDKTSNATPSIPASMPSDSYLIQYLERMKKCFETLFEVLQKNCKRETFKNKFQSDIKEMKDVFDSTKSDLYEIKKQNEFLKDQLLEANIKHEVEISVLKRHECVDNSLHAEIVQIQRNSIEIQEGMQFKNKSARKDVQKYVKNKTSPNKQRGANSNNHVMAPGMYRVVTKHESQTKETKSGLSSTGMNVVSSVRRPMHKDSNVKKSVLANSNISAKKVEVCVRKNKQTNTISTTIISNKENVIDVDVANAPKVKVVLCVSCMNNVLIPCHDKCLAKYKLNVHSNVRRALFTKSRIPKSLDTTHVVSKTRFSKNLAQSKSLDTTPVVSKTKIDVGSVSNAKHKVSSAINSTKGILRDMSLTKYMKDKIQTSRIWQKWFEAKPNVVWSPVNTIPNVHNSSSTVIQIVLWIVDSGCSKHMTGDRSLLRNFIEKFMGTVRFRNDNFAAITGYGDYIQGNITICHVYYVEGLGHNLFSVGQFCDGDLEVAFRSKTCYVRNLEGDDLLTGDRESNLYTISISDMAASSPVCLMSKATLTKSWLWHRRLSHLNFSTINDLTILDLVDGLPKFKYGKDHLCSACERGKSKKYILVIMDDYSHYTWIRTDNGTEFKNANLKAHYEKLGIMQQFLTARTPQQNGVVERRNRTLVEAARTMLIFSRLCEFLWAEAVATACFTQNWSIIHTRYNKTPYELLRGRKPNIEYFHVFGSLCYPTNDRDNLGKMKPKADIGVFIGYSETLRGFRIYNRRTKKIMETIHVKFDELTAMDSEHDYLEPVFQ
ncbi:retrovirus-related pol polyprotein from transposon TNT 1-94 [Tanacetum coccineum]